ncbi:MAG TPA: hypothetical protein VJQ59_16975 [Candidatus Sulfotelmatobacter sp.]|nr:hypothetical protein [Candidatus Sulfotelmatobacter sp.]
MDINIARFAPLTEQVKRIADALELMADLYEQDCEQRGVYSSPKSPVNDPIEAKDVEYVDEETMWINEMKAEYGIMSDEGKAAMKRELQGE